MRFALFTENLFSTLSDKKTRITAAYLPGCGRLELTTQEELNWSFETPYEGKVGCTIFASSISDRTFFVRMPDNSLVIIDGGWRIEDWMVTDRPKLLRMLIAEMQKITGGFGGMQGLF